MTGTAIEITEGVFTNVCYKVTRRCSVKTPKDTFKTNQIQT